MENGFSGSHREAGRLLYYVGEIIMTWTNMIAVEIERSQQILAILRVEFTGPGWWVTKQEKQKDINQ